MSQKPLKNSDPLIETIQKALAHQKKGEMLEAEKIYRQVIKENPDNSDVLHIAAIFFDQIGNDQYTLNLLKKLTHKKSGDFSFNALYGKSLYKNGDYEEVKKILHNALLANSEDADANYYMGLCVYKMGKPEQAEPFFRNTLKKQNSIVVKTKLCEVLLASRKTNDIVALLEPEIKQGIHTYEGLIFLAEAYGFGSHRGLQLLIDAILTYPERDEAKSIFALTLAQGLGPDAINAALRQVVSLCLASKNVNHINLEKLWGRQFFEGRDPRPAEFLQTNTYEAFRNLYEMPGYKDSLLIPYFIEGIKKILICTIPLENLVTNMRRYYLEKISESADLVNSERDFLAAVSHQSFFNEFVFNSTPEEQEKIESLDLAREEHLLIYSCYKSLAGLDRYLEIFDAMAQYSPDIAEIIQTQIGQVLAEKKIKKTIKSLGKIKDKTSRDVQDQYEENPYPRWTSCNFILPFSHLFVDDKYKTKLDVLIAGCGTGKHIFTTYVPSPWSKITAIDLSASSLAYAKIKTEEYGVKNIDFFQADILELKGFGKTFDSIESVGVLHHMKNPAEGLRILASLLKPGGKMKLGFYSELGRQDVIKARKLIAEKGFNADTDGIQACRAYIKASDGFEGLKVTQDFYSMSACRDLIFHVQETRYTIPEIEKLLQDNNLRFQKFLMPQHKMALYTKSFPDDKECVNLQNWHQFEQDNPDFFSAMYNFTCVKD